MDFLLEQGSSLHPAFQYAVDASFAALICVLVAMLAVTRSWHFVFLTFIGIGLWASVKWFVHELRAEKERQAVEDKKTEPESE